MDMTKILRVIKPFFVMEKGDTFEYDADDELYKSTYNEEHNGSNDDNTTVVSSYSSVYNISEDYAKMLIDNGYLEEVKQDQTKKAFVNIFDEISKLITKYNDDLTKVLNREGLEETPECMIVEKETVLRNMIKLLEHLNSLKK
jgi:predicted regulator of amino acid metabolism with ACT domain